MKRANYSLIAAALALASLPAVPAQAQERPSDTKCLVASNLYAKGATDDKARSTAMQATFFYLGRMSGSAADVQARLVAEARTLTRENGPGIMEACAKAMVTRAEELSGPSGPTPAPPQGR